MKKFLITVFFGAFSLSAAGVLNPVSVPSWHVPPDALKDRVMSFGGWDGAPWVGQAPRSDSGDIGLFRPAEVARDVKVRPLGAPGWCPPSVVLRAGHSAGPALASSLQWRFSDKWSAGADLMLRTQQPDSEGRMIRHSAYVVPGVEFTPAPRANVPVSIGLLAPFSFAGHDSGESGAFVYARIRW